MLSVEPMEVEKHRHIFCSQRLFQGVKIILQLQRYLLPHLERFRMFSTHACIPYYIFPKHTTGSALPIYNTWGSKASILLATQKSINEHDNHHFYSFLWPELSNLNFWKLRMSLPCEDNLSVPDYLWICPWWDLFIRAKKLAWEGSQTCVVPEIMTLGSITNRRCQPFFLKLDEAWSCGSGNVLQNFWFSDILSFCCPALSCSWGKHILQTRVETDGMLNLLSSFPRFLVIFITYK